jgi:metal-sulfur cluster biosynthetic enzyme
MAELINANPVVYSVNVEDKVSYSLDYCDEDEREPFTAEEVFHYIRKLNDPEHPLTLEQLNVVNVEHIHVNDKENKVLIQFTPTIPHCSMATLIGLCIRVKLLRSLPSRFKVQIEIFPGSHSQEAAINKQLNDKERVAAALENNHLLDTVDKCILTSNG